MKTRFIILISIIALSLIVSVSAFLLARTASTSPPSGEIDCKILHENPGSINIVYFATQEQAQKYTDYFLSLEPFSNHKDKFSFYYISPDQFKPKCELYQGIALLCYSSDLIKVAALCPNDYIVVLENKPSSIRSSAYKGVMSLNTNHPLSVFAHEFYHVFDNGAEEYYASSASIPRGAENCQKKCSDFRKFPEFQGEFGCYKECTTSNHYREFENGFMRSLHANNYGTHNILILNEEVLNQYRGSGITGRTINQQTSCNDHQFYLLEQKENDFRISLETGCLNGAKKFGDEKLIISSEPTKLHSNTLFTTDYNPDLQGLITSPSFELTNSPAIISFSANPSDTISLLDENDNIIFQTSLEETGAVPCKL